MAMHQSRETILTGAFCMLAGVLPILVVVDWLPVDPASIHAPSWVLLVIGAVFIIAGLMVIVGLRSRLNDALAAILLIGFAALGFWAAFGADADTMTGGIPFVSRETNASIGKWLFAIGAIMSGGMAVYAIKRALRTE